MITIKYKGTTFQVESLDQVPKRAEILSGSPVPEPVVASVPEPDPTPAPPPKPAPKPAPPPPAPLRLPPPRTFEENLKIDPVEALMAQYTKKELLNLAVSVGLEGLSMKLRKTALAEALVEKGIR